MPDNENQNEDLGRVLGSVPLGETFSLGKSLGFGGPQITQTPVDIGDYDISDWEASPSGELQPPLPTNLAPMPSSDSDSTDSSNSGDSE